MSIAAYERGTEAKEAYELCEELSFKKKDMVRINEPHNDALVDPGSLSKIML